MTNDEYLKELASRGDGSLQAWFDAEHVDNNRSAKRAAAVERVRKAKDAGTSIGYAIVGREYYPWEAYETLIELLTDDGGLTNLEWLFIDSEQFRQAVSAFAFAHADECPTSPTQMVDWLMTEHVDAQSKTQSKTESNLTEQSESLSDEATDSREKLEADVLSESASWLHTPYGFRKVRGWLDRQAAITRKTEQAAWIQQANGLIHEANVERDELREKVGEMTDEISELLKKQPYTFDPHDARYSIKLIGRYIDELQDELAKRDKGIARLKRQRDEARQELKKHRWEYCETCEHAEQVEGLEAERDALANDLHDCEKQRERLRQALGIAIDHAHEVVSLVNLDGEVIG